MFLCHPSVLTIEFDWINPRANYRKIEETTHAIQAASTSSSAGLSMGEQLKARLLAQRRKKLKRKAAEQKGLCSSRLMRVVVVINRVKLQLCGRCWDF